MKTTPKIKTDDFTPYVSDDFQIGPDGAFEYTEDEMKEFLEWDVTLMDGLENEPYICNDEWDNVSGDLILF